MRSRVCNAAQAVIDNCQSRKWHPLPPLQINKCTLSAGKLCMQGTQPTPHSASHSLPTDSQLTKQLQCGCVISLEPGLAGLLRAQKLTLLACAGRYERVRHSGDGSERWSEVGRHRIGSHQAEWAVCVYDSLHGSNNAGHSPLKHGSGGGTQQQQRLARRRMVGLGRMRAADTEFIMQHKRKEGRQKKDKQPAKQATSTAV